MDPDDHKIPQVPNVDDSGANEEQFEEPIASPATTGEEDSDSGDATDSQPVNIDEALKNVGLQSDEDHGPGSLNLDEELKEETE